MVAGSSPPGPRPRLLVERTDLLEQGVGQLVLGMDEDRWLGIRASRLPTTSRGCTGRNPGMLAVCPTCRKTWWVRILGRSPSRRLLAGVQRRASRTRRRLHPPHGHTGGVADRPRLRRRKHPCLRQGDDAGRRGRGRGCEREVPREDGGHPGLHHVPGVGLRPRLHPADRPALRLRDRGGRPAPPHRPDPQRVRPRTRSSRCAMR